MTSLLLYTMTSLLLILTAFGRPPLPPRLRSSLKYPPLEKNYFLLLRHHNITIKECYSRAAFFSFCMRCGVQLLSGVNLKKTELSILIRTWERDAAKKHREAVTYGHYVCT